jgi:hypothetical protein
MFLVARKSKSSQQEDFENPIASHSSQLVLKARRGEIRKEMLTSKPAE